MVRANHRRKERLAQRRTITRIIIVSLIFVAIGLLFISRTNDARFTSLRNGMDATGGRLVSLVGAPFRAVKNFSDNMGELRRAHADNEALRAENVELRQYEFRARALRAKLNQLEALMDVQEGLDIPDQRISVRVISETRGPFAYSVLVNAGQQSGVKVGYPVMHETGLLGHVIRVGRTSSRVLLLQDLNSRVSVMSLDTEARAVLIGKNDEPPELAFYDDASKWGNGQMVVTSGDDGILPQGLPIGQIIRRSDDDIRVATLSSKAVDWAWIYPFDPVLTPEKNPAVPNEIKDGDASIDDVDRGASRED